MGTTDINIISNLEPIKTGSLAINSQCWHVLGCGWCDRLQRLHRRQGLDFFGRHFPRHLHRLRCRQIGIGRIVVVHGLSSRQVRSRPRLSSVPDLSMGLIFRQRWCAQLQQLHE